MKLTFGELNVITDTLAKSLGIANWTGFDKEARETLLSKLLNAQDLSFDITVVKGEANTSHN